jgi:hypothetical protein
VETFWHRLAIHSAPDTSFFRNLDSKQQHTFTSRIEEFSVSSPAHRLARYCVRAILVIFLLLIGNVAQAQIILSPATLPNGAVGSTYGQIITAGGGTAPINFTVSSGTLPAGLKLGSTPNSIFATLGGVPTGTPGPSTFTVQATDSSVPPQTNSVTYTVNIAAADTTNNAELNGAYAFLFQGFDDSTSSMVVVAASFFANGQGTITVGFEDANGTGGAQPTQGIMGKYWLGADNRGTMELTTQSGTTLIAFSAGNIVNGVATKARLIRFDDVDGTTGHTGSGVMFKQDPSKFALSALNGTYAFGEVGSVLLPGSPANGEPQSATGLAIFDGQGNFGNGSTVDINNAGRVNGGAAISGTYALSNETDSNGRLTLSPVIAGESGTVSDVAYIIDDTQFIFISIDETSDVIYGGIAELQTTPGNFSLASLGGNSVIAIQGKQSNGVSTATIGSLSTPADGTFSFEYVQQNTGNGSPQTTGTANGSVAITPNGRAELTFPNGPFSPIILYLSGPNQGFAAETDTAASSGPLDPGGNGFSNASLSGSANFFGGSFNPATPQDSNSITVITFGATNYQPTTDGSGPGGILGADLMSTNFNYSVAANGALTVPDSGGVVGYLSSACKIETLLSGTGGPTLGTAECQGAVATNFTLTVTKAGTGTGTVTSAPAGINCGATCSASFASGTQVTLTAAATTGSTFSGWGAPCSGTGTCVVTITAATGVTATFAPSTTNFTLSVTKAGMGIGTVTSAPAGINCGATCSASFASGTQVTLTAAPATGSTFTGWGAPCSGTGTCVVTLTAATSVTATFTQTPNFTLTVTKAGTGTGTVTSAPAGINCGATCSASFASGTQVTLTAAPATGSTFSGWGAPCSGTGTCVVTITAATSVTATFGPSTTNFTLTVTKAGTGTGTVTSAPAGINCGATCSASFASGTQVTLTAMAPTGSTFSGWGAPCSGTGTCVVTLTAATSVTATFGPSTTNFTLSVTKAGTGTGTVTSAPAGINCGATCSGSFASGTMVTLTAAPATGSTFTGWGAPCSGTGTCAVTVTAATTVTATFTATNNFTLSVTKAGTGTGTVASAPAGINCGATCSASFASGTQVTLTAAPASGSTFSGWGAPCEGTGTCVVTVTAATTVTATFTQSTTNFALTVAEAGTGTGTVTSAPAGISCPSTCTANFAGGTQVTLTATPATGSSFAGWSGAGCTGTAGCSVTLAAAQTVTATFTKSTTNFTLTVIEAGSGTGTVSSAPAGISCQPTCSASFASGQVVALTANAADGSTFAGWTGAGCSGTAGCSVTMTAAQTVTATFNSGNSPVTITVAPGSPTTVSTTPGGGAVFGLLLTSTPGTTGNVTLGCTSPSPDITCQLVPGTITLTGKGTNVAIVVNTFCTAGAPAPFQTPSLPGSMWPGLTSGLGVLLASLALIFAVSRGKMKTRGAWVISFACLLMMTAVGLSACASLPKSPGGQATPPGNYSLMVTATAPNGSTSTVNLTLTVLP